MSGDDAHARSGHFLDFDAFAPAPIATAISATPTRIAVRVTCPDCGHEHEVMLDISRVR